MFEALYEEFGEENVHIVRRELSAKNCNYIKLLAELYKHNLGLRLRIMADILEGEDTPLTSQSSQPEKNA